VFDSTVFGGVDEVVDEITVLVFDTVREKRLDAFERRFQDVECLVEGKPELMCPISG
jgi:hypothetical protein